MRLFRTFVCFLFVSLYALMGASFSPADVPPAALITIKVLDPQDAPIAAAQVRLFLNNYTVPILRTTSSEGLAHFLVPSGVDYRVEVLAVGFAVETTTIKVPSGLLIAKADSPNSQNASSSSWSGSTVIRMRIAPASETVVVSATRTPVPGEDSGANADSLSYAQLTTLQPIAASDALRVLPGAVVNTAGQRGGL
ncbi:MAG: hypothetical protein ACRD3Q_11570, partial [Terriglobales bacterium]